MRPEIPPVCPILEELKSALDGIDLGNYADRPYPAEIYKNRVSKGFCESGLMEPDPHEDGDFPTFTDEGREIVQKALNKAMDGYDIESNISEDEKGMFTVAVWLKPTATSNEIVTKRLGQLKAVCGACRTETTQLLDGNYQGGFLIEVTAQCEDCDGTALFPRSDWDV